MPNELAEFLRAQGRDNPNACAEEKDYCEKMNAAAHRIEWLESLFEFSDDVVMNSAPGDPVTKDAVVVLRSHYETKRPT